MYKNLIAAFPEWEIGVTEPDTTYISPAGLEDWTEVSATLKAGWVVHRYPFIFLKMEKHYLILHDVADAEQTRMTAYQWGARNGWKVRTEILCNPGSDKKKGSVRLRAFSIGEEGRIKKWKKFKREHGITETMPAKVETPSESTEDYRRWLFREDRHAELRVYVTLSEAEKVEVAAGRKKIVVPMPQEQTEAPIYKEGEKSAEKNGTEKTENKIVENKNNILPASAEAPEIVTENNSSSEEAI